MAHVALGQKILEPPGLEHRTLDFSFSRNHLIDWWFLLN